MVSVFNVKPREVKNLLKRQQATPSQKDFWKKIIRYGENDNFPLTLARLVQKSPTATSCIDTKAEFFKGAGFSNPDLADLKINASGLRFGDLHSSTSDSHALFEGFAWNIKYNLKGSITEIYPIPFEYCRLGIPDEYGNISQILVNPYLGTDQFLMKYTKYYDVYNPDPKAILARMEKEGKKYNGQILYVATTSPLSRFYPVPKYYSANHWMSVDEGIGGFHHHNIDNGFFQSVMLKIIGDPNAPSTHPHDMKWNETSQQYETIPGRTNSTRFNEIMQASFSGWEKAGNIMALWASTKEESPEITPFPTQINSEIYKVVQDITTEQICRATKVPSILANIQSGASLGGDGNNIRASVKLMQQRSVDVHQMLERTYTEVLSKMNTPYTGEVKIKQYNPFPELEKADPLVWAALTLDEQRDWINGHSDYVLQGKAKANIQDGKVINIIPDVTIAPTNSFSNIAFTNYPQSAKDNARRAKDFREKMNSTCGGKGGWQMTDEILAGRPLSFKAIRRIYNYLNKNTMYASYKFSDSCEALLFSAWGGKEMLTWCEGIIKSINE